MIESATPTVWEHVSGELRRLRKSDSWLARQLAVGRNTVCGWKVRGVPPAHYEEIAHLFGWTIERLIHGEDAAPAPESAPDAQEAPPHQLSAAALSIAQMFDAMPDEVQRARAYALIVQIIALGS